MRDYLTGSIRRAVAIIHSWNDEMPGWNEVSREDRDRLYQVVYNLALWHLLESDAVEDSVGDLRGLLGELRKKYGNNANLKFCFGAALFALPDAKDAS